MVCGLLTFSNLLSLDVMSKVPSFPWYPLLVQRSKQIMDMICLFYSIFSCSDSVEWLNLQRTKNLNNSYTAKPFVSK